MNDLIYVFICCADVTPSLTPNLSQKSVPRKAGAGLGRIRPVPAGQASADERVPMGSRGQHRDFKDDLE